MRTDTLPDASHPQNETRLSEFDGERRGSRGPAPRADSLKSYPVGLAPKSWAFIEKYASPNDYPTDKKTGLPKWNPSPAMRRVVETLQAYQPAGPEGTPPRGSGGRFVGKRGDVTPRRNRAALERENARLLAEVEELRAALAASQKEAG